MRACAGGGGGGGRKKFNDHYDFLVSSIEVNTGVAF